MTSKQSAGILLYRKLDTGPLEVFLAHPGGPFWKKKDAGSWTIPKGEFMSGEPALDAAVREFREETGYLLKGPFTALSPIRQKGGKRIFAWASPGNLDAEMITSNTFDMQWPPGSGRQQTFPEIDRAGWFNLAEARRLINPAQAGFLEELQRTQISNI